jgi:hypothetical protein
MNFLDSFSTNLSWLAVFLRLYGWIKFLKSFEARKVFRPTNLILKSVFKSTPEKLVTLKLKSIKHFGYVFFSWHMKNIKRKLLQESRFIEWNETLEFHAKRVLLDDDCTKSKLYAWKLTRLNLQDACIHVSNGK